MKITPRPAQRLAVGLALRGLRGRFKRALVVMATGLGKTIASAFIARRFKPRRMLFLVHNNFILDHAVGEYRLIFPKRTRAAVYNGMSKCGAMDADIVFATWQTMSKNLTWWKRNHFDLVVVDEAHHSEADTYRPVVDYFRAPKLGITATPDREDDADIRDVFGPEVINITLEEAIARGWLPRVEYHVVTDESLDDKALQKIAAEIQAGKKRFTMAEVNRRIFIRKRDEEIAKIIDRYDEKSIVFCADIAHANRMSKSLESGAVFHSKAGNGQFDTWEKNQQVLDDLRLGATDRVCAVNAFNEGVNVPTVGLVAFCRVTTSLTIFRQQLGRGLRPGKDKLIVLDFVGNLERIQLVLEMIDKISDLHEKYTSERARKREGYKRERFEVSGAKFEFTFSDKVVDLMRVLEHVGSDFYPTWQEASAAARRLGLTKIKDYLDGYRHDPRLPSYPRQYENYPGDSIFFGREKRNLYKTWQEASRAAMALGIKSAMDYRGKKKADPRLPGSPEVLYKNFPGWERYLGREKRVLYSTLEEVRSACKRLGIKNVTEYRSRYKEDNGLPMNPRKKFGKEWQGWRDLFGRVKVSPYPTVLQASMAARRLKIRTQTEYQKRYKEDPRLPSSPRFSYRSEWESGGWSFRKFLGTKNL